MKNLLPDHGTFIVELKLDPEGEIFGNIAGNVVSGLCDLQNLSILSPGSFQFVSIVEETSLDLTPINSPLLSDEIYNITSENSNIPEYLRIPTYMILSMANDTLTAFFDFEVIIMVLDQKQHLWLNETDVRIYSTKDMFGITKSRTNQGIARLKIYCKEIGPISIIGMTSEGLFNSTTHEILKETQLIQVTSHLVTFT